VDKRLDDIERWAKQLFVGEELQISPASADASFRRYFRVQHQTGSNIIMDAPPDKEDSEPFVRISAYLANLDLNVPLVLNEVSERGFYLLTDLGSVPYLDQLSNDNSDHLYQDAMQVLFTIQSQGKRDEAKLGLYNKALLLSEMELFSDWFLGRELAISLTKNQRNVLQSCYQLLLESALQQPEVFVHRDYHSRNLMYLETHNPGILDFQDAVWGPITYDLVSLLRDCYITWPEQQVAAWVKKYYLLLCEGKLINNVSETQFVRWFDLMGMQRHLKASGIFSRLKHRDNKFGYIKDIPRTMNYILSAAAQHPEFDDFLHLMDEIGISEKLSLNQMENIL